MELKGKIINFLGDSITEGVGVGDIESNRFSNVIQRKSSCKRCNNYGIGGTRIAHQFYPSIKARWDMDFCGRCWDMDKEADIIVVFGGVNDYFHGDAAFGSYTDETRSTFCGAVNDLCKTIKELYPNAAYVFLAPAHCLNDQNPSQSVNKPANAKEHRPLIDYVNAIMEIAPKHGFHTYNMYENLGLDPNNPEVCEKYTTDGIHFNDLGHGIIADKITSFLESL